MFEKRGRQITSPWTGFFLILLSIGSVRPAHATTEQTCPSGLSHEMEDKNIVGLSMATIRHGQIVLIENCGLADKEARIPVTDNTLLSAASLSKPVFSYIVMQLVDEHKIDLDTPLYKYYPEELTDDPQYRFITPRIVLSHRTGFPDWRPKGGKLSIFFKPGERFSYSGEGYVYLQKTVENIEKAPLGAIAFKRVFQPLGMTHSTYVSAPSPLMAEGYDNGGKRHDPFFSAGNAAYSLMTTARDYALFLQAVLSGKGLSANALHVMESAQSSIDMACTYCTDHPPQRPSPSLSWGLGWGIEKTKGVNFLWHWGDNSFFKDFVYMNPKTQDAIVYFTNSENGLSVAPHLVWQSMGVHTQTLKWLNYKTVDFH